MPLGRSSAASKAEPESFEQYGRTDQRVLRVQADRLVLRTSECGGPGRWDRGSHVARPREPWSEPEGEPRADRARGSDHPPAPEPVVVCRWRLL